MVYVRNYFSSIDSSTHSIATKFPIPFRMIRMEVLYRQATINDYDQMYNLWKNIEGIGLSDSDTKENIEKFLNKNQGLNYICEEEGKIIGTILCGEDGRRGYLYHLAVDKDYRRKGIGTKLVNLVFDNLKKKA